MRRFFIKVITTLLAAAITVGMAGCGEQGANVHLNPDEPVSLEIWHYYNGAQQTAFDKLVTDFNETVGLNQGIIIEAFSQGSVNQLAEKVMESAQQKVGSSEMPAIFASYADTAYAIDRMGLAADLTPYFTKDEQAKYIDEYISEGRFDESGSLKIFPVAKSTEVLMLNQTDWDKFAQATGSNMDELSTMEGLVRVAQKYYEWTDSLTPAPNDGKAFFGRDAFANYMLIGSKQLGLEIFSVVDGAASFQTDQAVLRRLWDNYYVPFVNGWFGAYGRFRSDDAKLGKIISLQGSSSSAGYFPDRVSVTDTESYPVQVVSLPTPCFEGGEKVAVQQGAGMVVTKATPEQEFASVVFLKWFTEPERNISFALESGYLPVQKDANKLEQINAALEQSEVMQAAQQLKASIPVSVQTVNEYELYTSKAFVGGAAARNVLETSMSGLAAADTVKVEELVAGGMARAEAAAQFTTDAHFEEWYQAFVGELKASVE